MRIGDRFVDNLVMKACYWEKPRIFHFQRSLKCMVDHAVENIAVLLLGSGCDILDFLGKVLRSIERANGNSKIQIHIYCLMKDAVMLTLHYKRYTLFFVHVLTVSLNACLASIDSYPYTFVRG